MGSATDLTLAFINKRPAAAARVLASLPADDAAGFLDSIPTRYAVKVITQLNVRDAVVILTLANETTATAIFREMDFPAAAAIFRQLDAGNRRAFLAGLSRRQRVSFETTLAFAPDTVGAHMSTAVDVLDASSTAADALRLKTQHHESSSALTLIVNEKRTLIGVVPLLSLLRHPAATPLSELVDSSIGTVSPQMGLSRLRDFSASHRFDELPVISRRGEPVGVIFRHAILEEESRGEDPVRLTSESLPGAALKMMSAGVLGLTDLLIPGLFAQSGNGDTDVR